MKDCIIVGGWSVLMFAAVVACSETDTPEALSAEGTSTESEATMGDSVVPASEDQGGDQAAPAASAPDSTGGESLSPSGITPPSVDMMSDVSPTAVETPPDAGVAPEEVWTTLFNGENLDGWTASRGAGDGQTIDEIFQVTDGMIHVYKGAVQGSTQPIATLRTNDSYSSYVFHLQYMWGTVRFDERANTDRDAGILFHLFNNQNAVWPDAFELQMGSSNLGGEWISGDIFVIGSNARGQTSSTQTGGNFVFAELADGGMVRAIGAPTSYDRARANAKLDMPGWNTIELTVRANMEAEYKVNGVVVNRVFNMEGNTGGMFQPLQSGPIALQAEYAELFYRDVRIRELP
jgi:hypothetical protein